MKLFGRKPEEHEEFLNLCALSTTGELTETERRMLQEHLSECRECREAMNQFNVVVDHAIPTIGAEYAHNEHDTTENPWSQEDALEDLLSRLPEQHEGREWRQHNPFERTLPVTNSDTWRNIWTLYATAILLFASLSILLYKTGLARGTRTASLPSQSVKSDVSALQHRLADAAREAGIAKSQLRDREILISELRRSLHQRSIELGQFKAEQEHIAAQLTESESARTNLAADISDLSGKAESARAEVKELEEKLHAAELQARKESERGAALQAQIADLQRTLESTNKTVEEQNELLAHDRDIRELMGERDLYIAEVYDVDGTGNTRKPYGRVFFTKGKSLIFYAYDLDQQRALKNATFQAWGRVNKEKALSLGIFYEDNAAKKRWVVKSSDPHVLSRVDEVFVTIEPNGGSSTPSNRRILFASLTMSPNHP
jgi:DNA repair exonuclease SbcCD ATPase subunit